MKKNDFLLIGVVLVLAFLALGALKIYHGNNQNAPLYAIITQDNILLERIDLSLVEETREIILPGPYDEIVQIEKGQVRFKETNCPNQICVNTGWLNKPGEIAVCLPNKAIIRIEGY